MIQQVAVLLGLDARDGAVLAAVRTIAARADVGRVFLLHVSDGGDGAGRLDAVARALSADLAGVEVIGRVTSGRAEDEVDRLEEHEGIDLIVIGRGGEAGWGPHGLRVLRAADCPVLIVPDGATLGGREAVVGMDLSDGARAAMALAALFCARVRAVAAVDPSAEGADLDEVRAGVRKAWADAGGEGELEVVEGSPADALLAAAEGADLVAVGSRGLTPMAATLLGSTAERLGARAMVPVLVYRREGERSGVLRTLFRW